MTQLPAQNSGHFREESSCLSDLAIIRNSRYLLALLYFTFSWYLRLKLACKGFAKKKKHRPRNEYAHTLKQ
jgi:hypothetical protein